MSDLKNYWVSWYAPLVAPAFTLYWPWWISGYRMTENADGDLDEQATVVAAVRATSEDAAREIVLASLDERPGDLEWRFVDEIDKPNWSPYSDRFPQAAWMRWPEAATA